ncbi:MAG: ExbD/TolR family protein [Sutterellaceae bacterium]|nr:ExbD/TolR family protein [Burkholderiaceae bacterium]MCX7900741.1 ExbD/TolR family protein [Burkholderiaceae bacterium]MDW8429856.1 ExbD/TolR family protein [Sutterellaceae bacterium]
MAILARRASAARRRMLADINVVPYVDVMLVLVVILMVSAPFVNPSLVELPTVGRASRTPDKPLELVVRADGKLTLREGGREIASDLPAAIAAITQRQKANPQAPAPVVIAADKDLKYEAVLRVMDQLQRADIKRVGLAVRVTK